MAKRKPKVAPPRIGRPPRDSQPETDLEKQLRAAVVAYCERHGLSAHAFATLLGITSHTAFRNWMEGKAGLSLWYAGRIASHLDLRLCHGRRGAGQVE